MTFRTKPSVEAGIVHRTYCGTNGNVNVPGKNSKLIEIIVYEPGNGTRYEIVKTRILTASNEILGCGQPSYVFSWLNDVGKSMIITADGLIHHTYIMEKMHITSVADAMVLAELFGYLLDIPSNSMSEKERACTCHLYECGDKNLVCKRCGHVETEEERQERKREYEDRPPIDSED